MNYGLKAKSGERMLSKYSKKIGRYNQKANSRFIKKNKIFGKLFNISDTEDLVMKGEKRRASLLKTPTEEDFDQIVSDLDIFIVKKTNMKKITLQEDCPFSCKIEKYYSQLFKIYCRGKKPPLSVKIEKLEGKVKTYVSKTIEEPSYLFHDEIHMQKEFEIDNLNQRFYCEWIYLAVHALENSQIRISYHFGRNSFLVRRSIFGERKLIQNSIDKIRRSKASKSNYKRRKNRSTLDKRDSTVSESKSYLNFSDFFSRHATSSELPNLRSMQTHLLRAIYILKFVNSLRQIIPEKKNSIRFHVRKSFTQNKVLHQKKYSNLLIGRSKTIIDTKEAHIQSQIKYNLRQIILIQRRWRQYQISQTQFWDNLLCQWHICIGQLMEYSFVTNSVKENELRLILTRRNEILRKLIYNKKREFILKLRKGQYLPELLQVPSHTEINQIIKVIMN